MVRYRLRRTKQKIKDLLISLDERVHLSVDWPVIELVYYSATLLLRAITFSPKAESEIIICDKNENLINGS